jgi:hypothetical protein
MHFALDLYYSAKKLKAAGLQNQYPDWFVDTIRQKVRAIFYMQEHNLFQIFVRHINCGCQHHLWGTQINQ